MVVPVFSRLVPVSEPDFKVACILFSLIFAPNDKKLTYSSSFLALPG
jgi:hypothetical protein